MCRAAFSSPLFGCSARLAHTCARAFASPVRNWPDAAGDPVCAPPGGGVCPAHGSWPLGGVVGAWESVGCVEPLSVGSGVSLSTGSGESLSVGSGESLSTGSGESVGSGDSLSCGSGLSDGSTAGVGSSPETADPWAEVVT